MDYERRLRGDLEAAIMEHRGEDGAADLFDVRERRTDDEKQFYNREETREYVLDEAWS